MRMDFMGSARAVVAAAIVAVSTGAALGGGLYQDQVHSDSYGNLVIYSPAGYKRIVVGQGYLAEGLRAAQEEAAGPGYYDTPRYSDRYRRYDRHCNRQPVLLHGRSYMYGLPDNVVPVPAGICR